MSADTDLQACLASFRPSDRAALDRHLAELAGRTIALAAVKDFVHRWENADWLDAGSLERIGRWFGHSQPTVISEELQDWASVVDSDARRALLEGIVRGRAQRVVRETDLALSSPPKDAVCI